LSQMKTLLPAIIFMGSDLSMLLTTATARLTEPPLRFVVVSSMANRRASWRDRAYVVLRTAKPARCIASPTRSMTMVCAMGYHVAVGGGVVCDVSSSSARVTTLAPQWSTILAVMDSS